MMPHRAPIAVCAAVFLALLVSGSVLAAPGTPPLPQGTPPAHPSATEYSSQEVTTPLDLPGLKAVLIVGPIDGVDGERTREEISNMELAADELIRNGVEVIRLYGADATWEQVKASAQGAQFLLYRGHGIAWPTSGGQVVGGLALEKLYSPDDLRRELHLAPNAIVMIYACYAAGSDGGETNLDSATAKIRVTQYSDPFLATGAVGYYSDWWPQAFPAYIHSLFEGKTLREAYQNFWDYNALTAEQFTYADQADLALMLDKDIYGTGVDYGARYDNAFVGDPDVTLVDLFWKPNCPTPRKIFIPFVGR